MKNKFLLYSKLGFTGVILAIFLGFSLDVVAGFLESNCKSNGNDWVQWQGGDRYVCCEKGDEECHCRATANMTWSGTKCCKLEDKKCICEGRGGEWNSVGNNCCPAGQTAVVCESGMWGCVAKDDRVTLCQFCGTHTFVDGHCCDNEDQCCLDGNGPGLSQTEDGRCCASVRTEDGACCDMVGQNCCPGTGLYPDYFGHCCIAEHLQDAPYHPYYPDPIICCDPENGVVRSGEYEGRKVVACCKKGDKFLRGNCCASTPTYRDYNGNEQKACCSYKDEKALNGSGDCCSNIQTYTNDNGQTTEVCCSRGAKGMNGKNTHCCDGNKFIRDYKDENGKDKQACCDSEEEQALDGDGTCCLNVQTYTDDNGKKAKACCSTGERGMNGKNTHCCDGNKFIRDYKDENGKNKQACCEDKEEKAMNDGTCCLNIQTYKDSNGKEKQVCCPEGQLVDSSGHCCSNVQQYGDAKENWVLKKKCCPRGERALNGSGECCPSGSSEYQERRSKRLNFEETRENRENRLWRGTYWYNPSKPQWFCCNGTLHDYETITRYPTSKEDDPHDTIKICCKNTPPTSCGKGKGTLISDNQECKCGCWNDLDCNKHYKYGDPIYYCQADNTCRRKIKYSISDIEVMVKDFAGGKLTDEKVKDLIEKARKDKLTPEGVGNLKIVFSGALQDPVLNSADGYSAAGDKTTINIDSGICDLSESEDTLYCVATIVHENVHRMDEVKQPNMSSGSDVEVLYNGALSEINAQSTGALVMLKGIYERCYRYEDGQVYSTCSASGFDADDCRRCVANYKEIEASSCRYATKHLRNLSEVKKYFTDPSWSDSFRCGGLKEELEEDFIQNDYARRNYLESDGCYWSRKEAQKVLAHAPSLVRKAVQDFKKVAQPKSGFYEWILKLIGWKSRLKWEWTWPSPDDTIGGFLIEYNKNRGSLEKVCMTPERFANHPNILLGFEKINKLAEFEEAYAFVQANSDCDPTKNGCSGSWEGNLQYPYKNCLPQDCQDKLDCVTDRWQTKCWALPQWALEIGKTYEGTF